MTIKSDQWIRCKARDQLMIVPFVDSQVRVAPPQTIREEIDREILKDLFKQAGAPDEEVGPKVISYGCSSYGYDMRVADEFKVFTNVNSVIVDPKKMDERAFVTIKGDCIIPPNSFALCRSVEYFRIPDNVLCVVLGKCLAGDTRVVDAATGAYLPISDFADKSATVGMDDRWSAQVMGVRRFFKQGRKPVFKLTTRLGREITATANHPFRTYSGWTPLSDLKRGDRIVAAREIAVFGRTKMRESEPTLLGLMISEGQCHTPGHSPVFTNEDPVLVDVLRTAVGDLGLGTVTHNGRLGYRLVNHAGRGGVPEKNRAAEWLRSHKADVKSAAKAVPQAVFMAPRQQVREFLRAVFSGDGSFYISKRSTACLEYYSDSRRLVDDIVHLLTRFGIVAAVRSKLVKGKQRWRAQITNHDQIRLFYERVGFIEGSAKQTCLAAHVDALKPAWCAKLDTMPNGAWETVKQAARTHGRSFNSLGIRRAPSAQRSVSRHCVRRVADATGDSGLMDLLDGPVWDEVVRVEAAGEEETYDIEVPDHHNFFANGLLVHNSTYARCGIVCNVTPLEPCLSEDSEILTAAGWLPMADVQVGDRVLTRREDGVAEYQAVEAKQERHYRGSMLHFAGRSVDQLVTPDHKLFVWRRNPRQNSYEGMTVEAREVFGKHNYYFDRQVAFYGDALDARLEVGGQSFPRDAFLRFLGCWLGDGSAYRAQDGGYLVKLAAVTKTRKFDYYERVLRDMGIDNARRHDRGWQFYNKGLCHYLMQFGHAKEKFIDRRWMHMPPEALGLILDGLIESDGNRETMTFTTSSRRLADDVQELVFKSGGAAIVREVEEEIRGHRFTAYKVRVCEAHATTKMPPKNHKLVPYDGMVYDVTVPNHVFFMRRNGKASWTGNCWEGHVTIEISNTTPLPAKIYANEGIAQVLFFESDERCETSYADRKGKYQNQGPQIYLPKV